MRGTKLNPTSCNFGKARTIKVNNVSRRPDADLSSLQKILHFVRDKNFLARVLDYHILKPPVSKQSVLSVEVNQIIFTVENLSIGYRLYFSDFDIPSKN